jgi:hypothetical protein
MSFLSSAPKIKSRPSRIPRFRDSIASAYSLMGLLAGGQTTLCLVFREFGFSAEERQLPSALLKIVRVLMRKTSIYANTTAPIPILTVVRVVTGLSFEYRDSERQCKTEKEESPIAWTSLERFASAYGVSVEFQGVGCKEQRRSGCESTR